MKVLVCGGRDYTNKERVYATLDLLDVTELCSGAAEGVDTFALSWAKDRKITFKAYPVTPEEWDKLGRAAGVLRNTHMLADFKPELVVAFPGGNGTRDMVAQAKAAKKKGLLRHVLEIES